MVIDDILSDDSLEVGVFNKLCFTFVVAMDLGTMSRLVYSSPVMPYQRSDFQLLVILD